MQPWSTTLAHALIGVVGNAKSQPSSDIVKHSEMEVMPHYTRQGIYRLHIISMLHSVLINCKQRSKESGDCYYQGNQQVVLLSLRSLFVYVCACMFVCECKI